MIRTLDLNRWYCFFLFSFFFSGFRGAGWVHVDKFDSIVRHAMSTLIKPMTYGYEGQDDGFAYTSLLLSLCQELCLGCSVGDLVDGSLFPIFPKKKKKKKNKNQKKLKNTKKK